MASAEGTLSLQLALFKGDIELIQSRIKEVPVHRSIAQGGQVGQDLVVDFTKLTEAIARVDAQEEAYTQSLITQEAIRQDVQIRQADVTSKHGQVTQMHQSLQSVFDSEQARALAEESRTTAESQRVSSENTREAGETQRQSKETQRQASEAQRQGEETDREANENARIITEQYRSNAEAVRLQAEDGRVLAEQERATEEQARVEAEQIRELSEAERNNNEQARQATFDGWDMTMEGVIPKATSLNPGIVMVSPQETETETYTVPTVGTLDKIKQDLQSGMDKKVDAVSGKGLSSQDFTQAEKTKLQGIATGANKYIHPTSHSIAEVDGLQLELDSKASINYVDTELAKKNNYIHPTSHPISLIAGLQSALDSKVNKQGSIAIDGIAIINAGGSTAGLANNTIILELE